MLSECDKKAALYGCLDVETKNILRNEVRFLTYTEIVAKLKGERDAAQVEARDLIPKVKEHRDVLVDSGGMVNLDPDWKKEKLLEELDEIEENIQTSALDHKAEKMMIERRKKLIDQNERWLKDRRDSNPEMAEYQK